MNNNKLIIKFQRIEDVVFASPINIPKWAKGVNISYPENTFVYSPFAPISYHLEIDEMLLYIPPTFSNMDYISVCKFNNRKQAKNWIKYMSNAIEKLNIKHNKEQNMIMKNEKLVVDIGTFENIVILKVIDIPEIEINVQTVEKYPNDNNEDVSISFTTSIIDRDLKSIYYHSDDTGDRWDFLFPYVDNCANLKTRAITFSSAYKAKQFVKCFKKAVAEVNSQIEPSITEKESNIKWERCE